MKDTMKKSSLTDSEISLSSSEFIWNNEEGTGVHAIALKPICRYLREANAVHVLDLGCGNGYFTNQLSLQGFEVTGMDVSESGIKIAEANFSSVPFEAHDLMNPLSSVHHEKYDAVVSVEVIEHLLLPRKLMENASAALKPGGLLVISTPYHGYWKNLALALTDKFDHHWHPLRDFGHIKFFSHTTIRHMFQEYDFSNIKIQNVGRIPIMACSMIAVGTKAK